MAKCIKRQTNAERAKRLRVVQNSFTVDEIGARNGLSRVTVYNEINAARLRSFKVGKCRRITEEAEQDWIQAREAEAGAA